MNISRQTSAEVNVNPPVRDGLRGIKLVLTISSLSPLFILLPAKYQEVCQVFPKQSKIALLCGNQWAGWAIWGVTVALFVLLPLLILVFRERAAVRDNDTDYLEIEQAEDKREHLIAYLFAVFLPLYQTNAASIPSLLALLFSVIFVIWIFNYLNAYHVNPYFAMRGYRIFVVTPERRNQSGARSEPVILLTKKRDVRAADRIRAIRLGEGVYLDAQGAYPNSPQI